MRPAVLVVTLILSLVLACSGDDDAPFTPTATKTASPVPPTTTFTPPPTPTPAQSQAVASTVWLIDVPAGKLLTLREDFENNLSAYFTPVKDAIVVGVFETKEPYNQFAIRFGLDGSEIARENWFWPPGSPPCKQDDNGVLIVGRRYADVSCGLISPDGRWMTYGVNAGEAESSPGSGYIVPVWDQWLIDLETDERRMLQAGLLYCGGCDGKYGSEWSPSSRYLYFAESGGQNRTFLSDVFGTGATVINQGSTEVSSEPDWSPSADLLVYPGPDGTTLLHDLITSNVSTLIDMPWPVRFDTSGRYLSSPAWGEIFKEGEDLSGRTTAIYDLTAQAILATLPGQPIYHNLFVRYVPFGASQNGFVAALEGAPDCDGTAIYDGTRLVTCVARATGPSVSPTGDRVALTRKTGDTGLVSFPDGGSVSSPIYEVVVVNVATGEERVLAEGVIGDPPPLMWNHEGTLLLLRWPYHYGL